MKFSKRKKFLFKHVLCVIENLKENLIQKNYHYAGIVTIKVSFLLKASKKRNQNQNKFTKEHLQTRKLRRDSRDQIIVLISRNSK